VFAILTSRLFRPRGRYENLARGSLRWVLIIVGGIVGVALLVTFLPHGQQISSPHNLEIQRLFPHGPPQPLPPPRPTQPPVPVVTPIVKWGIIAIGLLLLFSFKNSKPVQTVALTLILSGALALLHQLVIP